MRRLPTPPTNPPARRPLSLAYLRDCHRLETSDLRRPTRRPFPHRHPAYNPPRPPRPDWVVFSSSPAYRIDWRLYPRRSVFPKFALNPPSLRPKNNSRPESDQPSRVIVICYVSTYADLINPTARKPLRPRKSPRFREVDSG